MTGLDLRRIKSAPAFAVNVLHSLERAGVDSEKEAGAAGILLAAKVAFLGSSAAYRNTVAQVSRKETHMSWVFLAGDTVYKLKKPVRFPYLDFSTLDRRKQACLAELTVNRRLAPGIYRGVVPLTVSSGGLAIAGDGVIVDWLVVMRRLADEDMLDRKLTSGHLEVRDLDRLAATLARFYRHAARVPVSPAVHLSRWRAKLAENRQALFAGRFGLDAGELSFIDRAQRMFLHRNADRLRRRVIEHAIVDGHGDLRPEHISLASPIAIIDGLEFNPAFRVCDPFDELASLAVECEHAGAGWVGRYLIRRTGRLLRESPGDDLLAFYGCYRATLRARLSIAHLIDPDCRTPEKWPRLAMRYLAMAGRQAQLLTANFAQRKRATGGLMRIKDRPEKAL
jgi:aminoglycoside phosphotransferase family enzyme